jgi:Zn-finger nucleic acid-binding protein
MSNEKDRLGEILHQAGKARENQWAVQRDAEILKRLREKYLKPIVCPQCGKSLSAEVAFGLGEMACPHHHGAWADNETVTQMTNRLATIGATHHESLGERISAGVVAGVAKIIEEFQHHHHEIDCPECGARLGPKATISADADGLSGMACPNGHGVWLDHEMLVELRHRLKASEGAGKAE